MDEIGKVGRILGTPGDDRISGPIFGHRLADDSTTFVDFIFGQGGNDTLKGGGDRDILFGGKGADGFVFAFDADLDRIKDFDANGKDKDRIDLTGYNLSLLQQVTMRETKRDTLLTTIETDLFGPNRIGVDNQTEDAVRDLILI
ncbi:MAG: hypothetical protein HRU31_17275 [Rhodobacteraceae bacterium]|nr:hypothetical protein [Paracoccaceae bacterium]